MSVVTLENYQKLAERTSATATAEGQQKCLERLEKANLQNALKCVLEMARVLGSDADVVKRAVFDGKNSELIFPKCRSDISRQLAPDSTDIRLLHAGLGLLTEACEFLEVVENRLFNGYGIDKVNLSEECGDVEWYLAEAANALGGVKSEILQKNIDKLRVRFPNAFTEEHAISRDLEAERNSLESTQKESKSDSPDEKWMELARQIAAQCWCYSSTEHLTMDAALAEAFANSLANWIEEAAREHRNAAFYRDLLDKCADNLGPVRKKVFIQDDGGIVDSPLRLKIPELVAELSKMVK